MGSPGAGSAVLGEIKGKTEQRGGIPASPRQGKRRFVKRFGGKENGAVVLPRKGEELRGALPLGLCL